MNSKLSLLLLAFLLAALLSSCSGGFTTTSWPGVTVNSEVAYLAYGQHVYAVNLKDGTEKWRFPAEAASSTFYAAPALTSDGQLIVGGYDNILYSLDPATGNKRWQNAEAKNRFVGSPLVTEKGIYAPNADGSLYALGFTNQHLWSKPFSTPKPLWAQPAVDDLCQCIFLIGMDHHLYAINADTGLAEWSNPVDLGGASVSAPTFSEDGVLYIGTFANEVLAVNAASGAVQNRFATQGWVWSAPALSGGRLYFGDLSGTFYVLDAATFSEIKRITVGSPVVGSPLVVGDAVYYTAEAGVLYVIDLDGNPIRSIPVDGNLYSGPVSNDGLILITPIKSGAVTLIALEPTGAQKWLFQPVNK